MIRKLLLLLIVIIAQSCGAQKNESLISSEIIYNEFSGNIAYETTAYVEKYWRVVGNAGFDSSIYEVVQKLENAGYISNNDANANDKLTFRIEKRALNKPTWEPVDAFVKIVGDSTNLLNFYTNRNMIAINSYSTNGEMNAEVIKVTDITKLGELDVKGKIVFAETHPYRIFRTAVVEGGAVGIITYNNPNYLQPEKNKTSIQFISIPLDTVNQAWGIALSFEANQRLNKEFEKGKVYLNLDIKTKIYESEELTVIAEIKGEEKSEERLVISAHVQEPGANDNASGVGVALEMAVVCARMVQSQQINLKRTLTFLWGDEIRSTNRYVQEDTIRAKNIKWGISLDMVGENTAITGGSFLIEKMPDPSAIWTRGQDKHTEWGGSALKLEDMKPHYLNDFVINRFKEHGKRNNWVVNSNPYEGGSDHVPFLKANIPSVLFWHFTDQFYHTDNDRLDKVSKETLRNVGTSTLISVFKLLNADRAMAIQVIDEVKVAGLKRLEEEYKQSKLAIANGDSLDVQINIIKAWQDWYRKSIHSCSDMVDDDKVVEKETNSSIQEINDSASEYIDRIKQEEK